MLGEEGNLGSSSNSGRGIYNRQKKKTGENSFFFTQADRERNRKERERLLAKVA
jgi:hypothetical protein